MVTSSSLLDSDFKYIDKKGNLLKSRTELTVAQMISFLNQDFVYKYELKLSEDRTVTVDFKTENGLIEIIDNEEDIIKYKEIKKNLPETKIMAVGHPKFAARVKELEEIVFYDESPQTGSIFLDDPSFAFDYAHILPLVEKCSILHGHTSSVMVEIVGQMKNNLLMDFADAKRIIKQAISVVDHKFFINEKYLKTEDDSHYKIKFDGPKGMFDLQVPKDTTYLLKGEATVENLSTELIKIHAPEMPKNVEAIGVYIYEGYNKGAHIISSLDRN